MSLLLAYSPYITLKEVARQFFLEPCFIIQPIKKLIIIKVLFEHNCVYRLYYKNVGCYKDTSSRAIPTLEGKDPILDGQYSSRKNPIAKCALAARKRGYRMFAIQDGGWCASSATARKTFNKYGKSDACRQGEGGGWANNVYVLQGQ